MKNNNGIVLGFLVVICCMFLVVWKVNENPTGTKLNGVCPVNEACLEVME